MRYFSGGSSPRRLTVGEVLAESVSGRLGSQPAGGGDRSILGTIVVDSDLRILDADLTAPAFRWLDAIPGTRVVELFPDEDIPVLAARFGRAITTRRPMVARVQRLPAPDGVPMVVSLTALPLPAPDGGLAITVVDMTRRLHAFAASSALGTGLDITSTARELAEALRPWGDVVAVSLVHHLWTGDQPDPDDERGVRLRRAALAPADRVWPAGFLTPGDTLPPVASALLREPPTGSSRDAHGAVVVPDRAGIEEALGHDPGLIRALIPADGPLALACAPLSAPCRAGAPTLLGMVEVWRRMDARWGPFTGDDVLDLQELTGRAGAHMDDVRRHQREHAQVLALQRRLLPPRSPTATVEVAGAYRPATPDSAGVGGDWFDVIPLSGGRAALLVGDVVGHGLGAAAAMGRLRIEAQALAAAGLAADEILSCLDETVARLDETAGEAYSALGSTCCLLVYDPVEHRCVMASAGHLPPALVHPDGHAELVEYSPHPPLGTSKEAFEATEFTVEPGTVVALYTDGLVEDPATEIDVGLRAMLETLSSIYAAEALRSAADRMVAELAPARRDDVTLLLARLSTVPDDDVATWRLPAGDAEAIAHARALTAGHLDSWGLARRSAVAELVVSELATNALRYGGGDVTIRLIRFDHGQVVCEVSDPSSARPHLRHPHPLDDGGRGLAIVQQLTDHWGVRYTPDAGGGGKTTWAELHAA